MEEVYQDYQRAIIKLDQALQQPKDEYIRDSAIKRFELCFDLAWKSIQKYAKYAGLECNSPRMCFSTAWQLHLIDYDQTWLEMIDARNLSVHLYEEKSADELYGKLSGYLVLFKRLGEKLSLRDN